MAPVADWEWIRECRMGVWGWRSSLCTMGSKHGTRTQCRCALGHVPAEWCTFQHCKMLHFLWCLKTAMLVKRILSSENRIWMYLQTCWDQKKTRDQSNWSCYPWLCCVVHGLCRSILAMVITVMGGSQSLPTNLCFGLRTGMAGMFIRTSSLNSFSRLAISVLPLPLLQLSPPTKMGECLFATGFSGFKTMDMLCHIGLWRTMHLLWHGFSSEVEASRTTIWYVSRT